MSKIATQLTDLVGNTPLLELSRYSCANGLQATLIAKLECFNPSSSVKDRAALAMIEAAERSGILKAGGTIIEPTSGNTGIGLAWICAARGYRLILTMPETMSLERRNLLKAYGAEIVLTPGSGFMVAAIAKAEELQHTIPGAIILQQFANKANPDAHRRTTAEEIWRDMEGQIDLFVAGVGTGGTISGVGVALKQYNPQIRIVAVEPYESSVLSGEKAGSHKIQGIGGGYVPDNYNPVVVDEIFRVPSDEAIRTSRQLTRTEGLLVGISSGAATYAATQLARRNEYKGKHLIVLMPDTGERYLSTQLYDYENYPL